MLTSINQFRTNFGYIRSLDSLYLFLKGDLKLAYDLSDLLRAEIVYSVSALDTLVHNLIKQGMKQSFNGLRTKTKKFKTFSISAENLGYIQTSILNNLVSPSMPLPEFWFEQEIVIKHKAIAFQDPDKISDGLSLIWDEDHKWAAISLLMRQPENDIRTTLKNIVIRRNQIVHESDIDVISSLKNNIEHIDVKASADFIERLGESIYISVR